MSRSYGYDIHGLVRVRSAQRLPELGYFASSDLEEPVDIEVKIVAAPKRFEDASSLRYSESPGRLGFQVVLNRDEVRTWVYASPLIGQSPHVLYTNVVEPIIRWTLVRKGHALMHGATLAEGGRATFITARTDTGKTTTVLKILREYPDRYAFMSDDMTIFQADGRVRSYPKPLTISRHTVHAIGGAPLRADERLFLPLQSRLHSRGGRRAGMWISARHMPAATLSAVVQRVIPPPKFMPDRLLQQVQYTDEARLACILVIERGSDDSAGLSPAEAVETLMRNAEDAYGFPPYPVLARALSRWHGQDLQPRERQIVTQALTGVPCTLLRRQHYDWHLHIPELGAAAVAGGGLMANPSHAWLNSP